MATPLGRLHRVDVREVWASEPTGFTPWLAQEENLLLLAEKLERFHNAFAKRVK